MTVGGRPAVPLLKRVLERMHKRGWKVKILSWRHSCDQRMRRWAVANGVFVALDDFYEARTFLEPSKPGCEFARPRVQMPLDLSQRPVAEPHIQSRSLVGISLSVTDSSLRSSDISLATIIPRIA